MFENDTTLYLLIPDDSAGTETKLTFNQADADAFAMNWCIERWNKEDGPCPDDFDEALSKISEGNDYLYFKKFPLSEIDGSEKLRALDELFKHQRDLVKLAAFSGFATDSEGIPCTASNLYRCEECNHDWQTDWSCACDDRCPECNSSTSPHHTNDETPDELIDLFMTLPHLG